MDYKDKIRKLLALAKSPEPEEAKLALLKARKLMAEHKLSERDLEERNTTVIKRAIGEKFSKKANSWMDPLSIVIGENYCCSAFRCKISAKTTVWHVGFIGLEGDIEICVKIFRYAVRCIKSEQKKLRKQHRDYYTPQEIAKICDSYGYGFARGVYEAFTRQNEENQEYGLVLKVPEEVKDELEKDWTAERVQKDAPAKDGWRARRSMARRRGRQEIRPVKQAGRKETGGITDMASTKFEVSMEIFKFQGEPDVSVTLTGKSPAELDTALKTLETIAKTTTLYNGDSAPEAEKSVTSEPKQAASVVSTADKKAPPQEAGKLAYARRRKGAHAPALPEMQERVCTVLARTANDQRVPEVRRENPAGRAGTVRVHLPGLQEGELRSDERRGRRNRKREVLLRLRPEHPEAHVEPGQALLYDVRRAG